MEAESSEEMFEKERELVELGPHSYNLKEGGRGGFERSATKRGRQATNRVLENRYGENWRTIIAKEANIKSQSEESTLIRKETAYRGHDEGWFSWKGKHHSDESKRLISEKAKMRLSIKENNSQFGTMWITNEQENRKIKKDDAIPEGWRKGRIIKY